MSDNEFPKDGAGSGRGTVTGYTVEAKLKDDVSEPIVIDNIAYGHNWKRLPPPDRDWPDDYYSHSKDVAMLGHAAAQVNRWLWLHACGYNRLVIATRLVKHKITYSYEIEAIGETDIVDGTLYLSLNSRR